MQYQRKKKKMDLASRRYDRCIDPAAVEAAMTNGDGDVRPIRDGADDGMEIGEDAIDIGDEPNGRNKVEGLPECIGFKRMR